MAARKTTFTPIRSLTHFIDEIARYVASNDGLKCYRGQMNFSWENIPGILRPSNNGLLQNEKAATRDLISVHPQEFISDDTMFDKLVRMQHFGLPTRLLDVGLNPLVALYFATEEDSNGPDVDGVVTAFLIPAGREKYYDSDAVSCIANLANMTEKEKGDIQQLPARKLALEEFNSEEVIARLLQFVRAEKPYFLPILKSIDLFKPYYVHPKMSNRRLIAQSGAFIIYGLMPSKKIIYTYKIHEFKFRVSQSLKGPLRKELANLGINESTLYPELDKAAKQIKLRYN